MFPYGVRKGDGLGDIFSKLIPFIGKLVNTGQRLWSRHGEFAKKIGKHALGATRDIYQKVQEERNANQRPPIPKPRTSRVPAESAEMQGGRIRFRKRYRRGMGKTKRYIGRRKGGSFISNIQPGPLP
jgi:hypothetical protein